MISLWKLGKTRNLYLIITVALLLTFTINDDERYIPHLVTVHEWGHILTARALGYEARMNGYGYAFVFMLQKGTPEYWVIASAGTVAEGALLCISIALLPLPVIAVNIGNVISLFLHDAWAVPGDLPPTAGKVTLLVSVVLAFGLGLPVRALVGDSIARARRKRGWLHRSRDSGVPLSID